MDAAFQTLPPEVLCRIFSFLGVADRLTAGLACKSWHKLATDSRIYGDMVIKWEKNVRENMEAFTKSVVTANYLSLNNARLHPDAEFWEHIGLTLKRLDVRHCDFDEDELAAVLLRCPNLDHLAILDWYRFSPSLSLLSSKEDVLRHTLSRVKTLDLSDNANLTDAAFHRLATLVSGLHSLSLEGCVLCVHPAIERRFYPPEVFRSPLVTTFQKVLQSLLISEAALRVLNLSRTMIDNKCVAQVSATFACTLEELHAASCPQLGFEGVKALCYNATKLKCLNLSANKQLKNNCLDVICENLKHLEKLNISNCTGISSARFGRLAQLGNLRCASFASCGNSDEEIMVELFSSRPWQAIRELDISSCNVSDAVVRCLAEQMPTLELLDVSQAELLTDDSVRTIWTSLRRLQVLRMARCPRLTNAALSCPSSSEQRGRTSLACLVGLRELSINGCQQLSDDGVVAAISFRELTSLDISHCELLTSVALEHIARHVPSLTKLVMGYCVQLDDGALKLAFDLLSRLHHVSVQGCRKITDQALRDAVSCQSLKYVNVRFCMVTLNVLQWLLLQRPDLELVYSVDA